MCTCYRCDRELFEGWLARLEEGIPADLPVPIDRPLEGDGSSSSARLALIHEIHRSLAPRFPLGVATRLGSVIRCLSGESEDGDELAAELLQQSVDSLGELEVSSATPPVCIRPPEVEGRLLTTAEAARARGLLYLIDVLAERLALVHKTASGRLSDQTIAPYFPEPSEGEEGRAARVHRNLCRAQLHRQLEAAWRSLCELEELDLELQPLGLALGDNEPGDVAQALTLLLEAAEPLQERLTRTRGLAALRPGEAVADDVAIADA